MYKCFGHTQINSHEMYVRLDGLHALMSFGRAIGSLMAESGLSDIWTDVLGGVHKMLIGKKVPA